MTQFTHDTLVTILKKMPDVNPHLKPIEVAVIRQATAFLEINKPRPSARGGKPLTMKQLFDALDRCHTRNAVLRARIKQLEKVESPSADQD